MFFECVSFYHQQIARFKYLSNLYFFYSIQEIKNLSSQNPGNIVRAILHVKYTGRQKRFRPEHEDGSTCSQKLGSMFAHALIRTHKNCSYFAQLLFDNRLGESMRVFL